MFLGNERAAYVDIRINPMLAGFPKWVFLQKNLE